MPKNTPRELSDVIRRIKARRALIDDNDEYELDFILEIYTLAILSTNRLKLAIETVRAEKSAPCGRQFLELFWLMIFGRGESRSQAGRLRKHKRGGMEAILG
jgi:hypothetical protein